jgi:hypothetical protein
MNASHAQAPQSPFSLRQLRLKNIASLYVGLLLLLVLAINAPGAAAQGLSDMPTVERIKAEIKGSDPTDTLARQTAIFSYLVRYVDRVKYSRTVTGPFTPEEQKLYDGYRLAAYQIDQDYRKTHTPAEVEAFGHLEGKYEFDSEFYKDWSSRLIGKQSAATYHAAERELGARQQAHIAAEKRTNDEAQARTTNAQGLSNDPTAVATRRCLELGGSNIACMGKGFGTGFMDMIGLGKSQMEQMTGAGPAGVVLQGLFKSNGTKTTLGFNTTGVAFGSCGSLDQAGAGYTIEKRPGAVRILVHNQPAPFTLAMRPDGGLVGPGPVDVLGSVIVGYSNETTQYYRDGVSVGAGYADECGGPCRKTTSTPIYKPKTDRCTIGSYNPPPPPPPSTPQSRAEESSGVVGMLTGIFDTGEMKWDSPPGLRMSGEYDDGHLKMEFSPATVILDCGEAHVRLPYTVENAPDQFLVHIQNNTGAFTLAVAPDNTLRGQGSTTVNGRLVSGMQGENVTFRPHSETCEVGTFRPKTGSTGTMKVAGGGTAPPPASANGAPATSASVTPAAYASPAPPVASGAAASPAPSTAPSAASGRATPVAAPAAGAGGTRAAMRVLLSSEFQGGTNPMAGGVVWVMRERMDAVLRSLGAPLASNVTPAQAWMAFAVACKTTDCKPVFEQLKTHLVTTTKLDATGKATISSQSASSGTYYFFAQVRTASGLMVWDVPANVVAGDNSVTLTAANAELIH